MHNLLISWWLCHTQFDINPCGAIARAAQHFGRVNSDLFLVAENPGKGQTTSSPRGLPSTSFLPLLLFFLFFLHHPSSSPFFLPSPIAPSPWSLPAIDFVIGLEKSIMAEYLGSLFGGEKEQAPVVAADDGMCFPFSPAVFPAVSPVAIWPHLIISSLINN